MSDDDDVPDLAYSSGEDEEQGDHIIKWLVYMQLPKVGKRQEHAIRIYTLGPFLYGEPEQPEKWIKFCQEVKLLDQTGSCVRNALTDEGLQIVEFMEQVLDTVTSLMHGKVVLKSVIDMVTFGEMAWGSLDECLHYATNDECIKRLQSHLGKQKFHEKVVAMGIVFACRQYVAHFNDYIQNGKDWGKVLDDSTLNGNKNRKAIEEIKAFGNTEFKNDNFMRAIQHYSKAIVLDSYNHILYGNRCQAYLKNNQYREALLDGKRAIVLKDDWAKGYYRYAQSYYELGRYEEAMEINKKARGICDRKAKDYGELDQQKERFKEKLDSLKKENMKKSAVKVVIGKVPRPGSTLKESNNNCSDKINHEGSKKQKGKSGVSTTITVSGKISSSDVNTSIKRKLDKLNIGEIFHKMTKKKKVPTATLR